MATILLRGMRPGRVPRALLDLEFDGLRHPFLVGVVAVPDADQVVPVSLDQFLGSGFSARNLSVNDHGDSTGARESAGLRTANPPLFKTCV